MPFIHPSIDSGRCVKALIEAGPPQNLAAMGSTMSAAALCEHLTREFSEQKIKFVFEQVTPVEFESSIPGPAGPELAAMWQWIDQYGYYGQDDTYVYPKDVSLCRGTHLTSANFSQLGIENEIATVEQVMTRAAWTRNVESARSVDK